MCGRPLMCYVTYNKPIFMLSMCMGIINIKSPEIDDDEDQLMVVVNRSSGFTPIPDTGLLNDVICMIL